MCSPIQSFEAPSFVIFHGVNDAAYASFSTVITQKCFYPAYDYTPCTSNFTTVQSFQSEVYGNLTGYFFDGSGVVLQNLSSKVLLNMLYFSDDSIKTTVRSAPIYSDPDVVEPLNHMLEYKG
jgi:hypothetical protein